MMPNPINNYIESETVKTRERERVVNLESSITIFIKRYIKLWETKPKLNWYTFYIYIWKLNKQTVPFLSTVNLKIGHDLDFMLHQVYNKNKIILGTFFKQVMTVIHLQNEKKKRNYQFDVWKCIHTLVV